MTHGMRTERNKRIIPFARNGTLILLLTEQQGHIQRGSVPPPEIYKSPEGVQVDQVLPAGKQLLSMVIPLVKNSGQPYYHYTRKGSTNVAYGVK
jgi:hypothetical protein